MKARSASAGMVWRRPTPRMTDSAFPAARSRTQAERDGEEDRNDQRSGDELDVAEREARDRRSLVHEVLHQRRATLARRQLRRRRDRADESEWRERVARHGAHGFSFDLDALVQRAHPRDVDLPAELLERGDRARLGRGQARADERRGLVGREEVAIVAEHREVVPRDQSVGRVAVDDVDLPGGERLILDRRTERTHLAKMQIVGMLKSDEAVGSSDEIGGEAGRLSRRGARDR